MRNEPPKSRPRMRPVRGAAELEWIQSEFLRVGELLERERAALSMHPEDVAMRRVGAARSRLRELRALFRTQLRSEVRAAFGGPKMVRLYCGHLELVDLVSGEIVGLEAGHPNLSPHLAELARQIDEAVAELELAGRAGTELTAGTAV